MRRGTAYGGSSRDAIAAFKHVLDRARIPATVRLTRGRDIAAACGQLHSRSATSDQRLVLVSCSKLLTIAIPSR